ncbi:Protein of unknown function DUF1749 [Penicillium diatomitis]|uniref:Uncharacterized protein n=1 Tax=Penicillium diatomitis TaxID=2819901 RepID=A0A9W9X6S4_9EURO|nr:Protein of unknown function DUF1749 [Penicillium diatomitis]KAJ5485390.1 Protein of unknown function DUF1749 [Penicillium diatomitis]
MQLKILTSLAVGQAGILHHITTSLIAFEHTHGSPRKPHTLLFIGGLGDGLGTVEYLEDVVAVEYIRKYKEPHYGPGKVVLMGHSTGSQDVMHYLYSPKPRPAHPVLDKCWEPVLRTPVDGAIMQAPVSDREAILWVVKCGTARDSPASMRELYKKAVFDAERNTYEENESVDTIVPLSVTSRIGYPANAPVSSRRFLSLVSPKSPAEPSEDDLFSSDLTDARLSETFGSIGSRGLLGQKMMVLYSGRDQSVPDWVDKEVLLDRWEKASNGCGRDI